MKASELLARYLVPPYDKKIRFRHLTIVGLPESGKTTLAMRIAEYVKKAFRKNVNLIYTRDLRVAIDSLNNDEYQLVIVDDAVRYQHSRRSMQHHDIVADFYEIRHIFEKQHEQGILSIIFLTQRFQSLDVVFRNAPIVIFKTVLTDPYDNKLIQKLVGAKLYRALEEITRKIYLEAKDSSKSYCVLTTAWGDKMLFKYRPPKNGLKNETFIHPNNSNGKLELTDNQKQIIKAVAKHRSLHKAAVELGKTWGAFKQEFFNLMKKIANQI